MCGGIGGVNEWLRKREAFEQMNEKQTLTRGGLGYEPSAWLGVQSTFLNIIRL